MCTSLNLKLLIIDSLAGMVRFEYDPSDLNQMIYRTTYLFKIASKLKWLSDTFNLGIVVVNQVTASNFDKFEGKGKRFSYIIYITNRRNGLHYRLQDSLTSVLTM